MEKLIKNKAIKMLLIASFVFFASLFGLFLMPKTSGAVTLPAVPCPDFNNDGKVSLSDLSFFSQTFGLESGDTNYNPQADFDQNNKINEFDKLIFQIYYNDSFICGTSILPDFSQICPDYNGDGKVSLSDLSFFTSYQAENNLDEADFDLDGDIDEIDTAIFEAYYNTNYDCPAPKIAMSIEPALGCFPNFVESNQPNFVDLSDFAFFSTCYGSQKGEANYQAICDVNSDDKVGDYDKSVFELYYNKPFTCQSMDLINFKALCPDFNGDHEVSLSDLSFFAGYMASQNLLADFDGDGVVDENDKKIFELYYNTNFICQDYSFLDTQSNQGDENDSDNDTEKNNDTPVLAPEPDSSQNDQPEIVTEPEEKEPEIKQPENNPVSEVKKVAKVETGTVLGAAIEAEEEVKQELPKAGADLVFWLFALANSTLGLYSLKRIK